MCVIYDIQCGNILFHKLKKRNSKNKFIKFVNAYNSTQNFQVLINQLINFYKITQKHDCIVSQNCIFNKKLQNKQEQKVFSKLINLLKRHVKVNTYDGTHDLNVGKIEEFILPYNENDFIIEF